MKRILRLKNLWKDLPVSHKLYTVVGVMAVLIATELVTLIFAMNILSAVRAFVGGEGLWSKAQKGAVLEIQNYARTRDEKYYSAFKQHLLVPLGDHDARVEMNKQNMSMSIVTNGFLRGQIHPHDVVPMVQLMRRFYGIPYIHQAILIWDRADNQIFQLIGVSDHLHRVIKRSGRKKANEREVQELLTEIFVINDQLTKLENQFSSTLGEASRWLEQTLMILLMIAVISVESTGLLLTITFGRGLTRVLNELNDFANNVGAGDFSKTVPVHSNDELGGLARALNKMAGDLQEMSSERQIAERANRIKNLFLANMSHEIRTPLNAILGFVELLKENSLSRRDSTKYLEIIERTGTGLATIINDILDISKVEAGKLEIERAPCSPQQLIRDLEALLRLRCEEKGIQLKFALEDLPDFIVTDPSRLKQILLNIIGNAIKFTDKGEVNAIFHTEGKHLVCTVQDTGMGISQKSIESLFQPFSQVDLSIRKQFGGTGLGLILSRRLAQLLGGDVRLKSTELDRGSTFEIAIAFEETSPPLEGLPKRRRGPLAADAVQTLAGKKVLLVEDSLDNQLLAQQFLLKEGADVEIVGNGLEALKAMNQNEYDVVLMDMQMPVMDGYTATTQLRRLGYQTPIIALTAHAMKDDLEKCLRAGCDDYLCKPFRRKGLISLIGQYCQPAG